MKIAIDFDGTCVTHEYPNIGAEIGSIEVLRELAQNGNNLILFTMRSGKELQDAIQWFEQSAIQLYSVQYDKNQQAWTASNKCYAELYIDDAGLGIPLVIGKHNRAYVDWIAVRELLVTKGLI